jgi:hypothetical protein
LSNVHNFFFKVNKYIDHFCWSMIGNQHMRLIERLPYICIMPLPHTFIYSAFPRTFNARMLLTLHTYDKEFSVGISYDCNNTIFCM